MPGRCKRQGRTQAPRRRERQRPKGRRADSSQQTNEASDASLPAEPDAGILVDVVDAHLEMQVRSRRPAGGTFVSDEVASGNDLAALYSRRVTRQVAVVRRVTVAVEDDDVVAVADAPRVQVDDARVGRDDRGSVRAGDVDPGVDSVRVRAAVIGGLEIKGRAPER